MPAQAIMCQTLHRQYRGARRNAAAAMRQANAAAADYLLTGEFGVPPAPDRRQAASPYALAARWQAASVLEELGALANALGWAYRNGDAYAQGYYGAKLPELAKRAGRAAAYGRQPAADDQG